MTNRRRRLGLALAIAIVAFGLLLAIARKLWLEDLAAQERTNQRWAELFITPRDGQVFCYAGRNVGSYLAPLRNDASVHYFGMEDCTFGPDGSQDLLQIPNLREVMLCGMAVSSEELQPILAHPAVRGLALVYCKAPLESLTEIAAHKQLERLVLAGPSITSAPPAELDRFLDQLAKAQSLKALWLSSPPFSAAAIARLRAQRPNLHVQVVGESFWGGEASDAISFPPTVPQPRRNAQATRAAPPARSP